MKQISPDQRMQTRSPTPEPETKPETDARPPPAALVLPVRRKKRRFRPGTVALRDIRKAQAGTKPLLDRAPFRRLLREVLQSARPDHLMSEEAKDALQTAAEAHLTTMFRRSVTFMLHADRVQLQSADVALWRRVEREEGRGGPIGPFSKPASYKFSETRDASA